MTGNITTATDFRNTILNGDSGQLMRALPRNAVDFILTDPPYLVNYQGRDGRKVRNDDNARWLRPAFNQMHRILKWGGLPNAQACLLLKSGRRSKPFQTGANPRCEIGAECQRHGGNLCRIGLKTFLNCGSNLISALAAAACR